MTKQNKFKKILEKFDTNNPDFSEILPFLTGELEVDLEDFRGELVGKWGATQTLWQLSQPEKPKSRSRVWKTTNGYIYLTSWANASLLRVLGTKWLRYLKEIKGNNRNLRGAKNSKSPKFPQSPIKSLNSMGWKLLDRLEAQFLDCLRSTVANIEEGFARPTTSEYLTFLGYSQGSLSEAKGDFERSRQDGFLPTVPGSNLKKININLRDWHKALKESVISKPHNPLKSSKNPSNSYKSKGSYRILKEFKFNYPPVDNLDPSKLTYEMFIELTNKTDWHLRKLVESLEKKLNEDQKGYKIEKARIRSNLKRN